MTQKSSTLDDLKGHYALAAMPIMRLLDLAMEIWKKVDQHNSGQNVTHGVYMYFQAVYDSCGCSWGFRGKGPQTTAGSPKMQFLVISVETVRDRAKVTIDD